MKSSTSKKKASALDLATVQFIKDHVTVKLTRAGWEPGKAADLVDLIPDSEISETLGVQKVGALGDGSILKWLKENGPKLREAVDKVFNLLALLGVLATEDGNGEK